MAQFEVSTSKLTQEAQHLRQLKQKLKTEIDNAKKIAVSYLNMWDGEAKAAFVNSANKNLNLLEAFVNNMDKFAQALQDGATSYEDGEREAKRIAMNKGQ